MAAAEPVSIFKDIRVKDANSIEFTLSPTRVAYANSLRRAMQTHVRTVGFRADMTETGTTSDVLIYKNSTPMSNEMLADRIGLLPIHEENVDGWDKDRYLFKLHVKNETPEIRHVTASDFEVLEKKGGSNAAADELEAEGKEGDNKGGESKEADGKEAEDESSDMVKVPNRRFFRPDPISRQTSLIATLKPQVEGQPPEEIYLEARASVGMGHEHIRFSPICIAAYGNTLDSSSEAVTEKWVTWLRENKKVDPRELAKDAEKKAELEREFRTMEIYRAYLKGPDGEPYSFDWKVESAGVIPPTVCVYRACLGLVTLFEKYVNVADGDLPESMEIRPAESRLKGYDVIFQNEDYTLGNALQTWIDEEMIAPGDGGVNFVGFKVPHPLRAEGVLRIGMEDPTELGVRQVIARAAEALVEMYRKWASEWESGEAAAYITMPKKLWDVHAEAKEEERRAAIPVGAVEVKKPGAARSTLVRPTAAAAATRPTAAAGPVVVKKK